MFDVNGTATATLTINTAAVGALLDPHRIFHPFYALALPLSGLAFIGLGFTSKVRNRQLIGALLAGVLLLGVILTFGCGGGGNGGGGTQTYVITVTGTTAQQTTHNTTVSLTVQ